MPNDLSILIVRLSAIGDVVMTTAAVRALRRHLPGARISWVVEPKSAGILEGNPDVDEIIIANRINPTSLLGLSRKLRKQRFDAALDFQGLARSALVTAVSGAKRRIGYANSREFSDVAYNETVTCPVTLPGQRCRHGMPCYMRLIEPLGIIPDGEGGDMRVVVSDEERESAKNIIMESGISPDEPVVAFCPATTRANKHWTEAGWARLAGLLWQEMGLSPVFLGATADQPMIERIIAMGSSPAVSLAGKTSLKQAVAVLDMAKVVSSVDTGLLHVGVALGKPTVGIFGPTTAWRNHIGRENFAVVRKDMDCVPCYKRPNCKRFECISDITPEEVLLAVRSIVTPKGAESCKAG